MRGCHHRPNGDDDDAGDTHRYYLTDAQYSPWVIVDDAATDVERLDFTDYGYATHHRPGDRWIKLHLSTHPADLPGMVGIDLGVGPAAWPESKQIRVPLGAYMDATTIFRSCSFSAKDDMRSIAAGLCRDLPEFASDFMSGDLTAYDAALSRRRF